MDRKKLTFEQAEGASPLPTQLALQTLSRELRSQLYLIIHDAIWRSSIDNRIDDPWFGILVREFVLHQHGFIDEFDNRTRTHMERLKQLIKNGTYYDVLGYFQYIIRDQNTPTDFVRAVADILTNCRSAYRVIDNDTIAPISQGHEAEALEQALVDSRSGGADGARSHLKAAIEAATAGKYSDCIREAIHAVEAVAILLAPGSDTLGPALSALEKKFGMHPAMKKGFSALYGFTNDEKGIRHSLIDQDSAKVDEADALFMLGACAAFVSYLLAKGRAAGLIG